jgi:DNA-binding response OmpR family regulator
VGADPTLTACLTSALGADPHGPLIVTTEVSRVAALRAGEPAAALLVVGVRRAAVAAALDDGADVVLPGPLRPAELRARLRALERRRERRLTVGPIEIRPSARLALLDGVDLRLPRRELALLCCLAAAPGRVFSKAELLRSCWDAERSASRTLERHAVRLRARLGRHAPMLVTVWGVGYRLDEPV